MMYASEIEAMLKTVKGVYEKLQAICAIDQLPESLKQDHYLIINTE